MEKGGEKWRGDQQGEGEAVTLDAIKTAIGMKPYYEEPAGVIYNADCLDILPKIPEKSVDLVLTDPPYGIGQMRTGGITKHRLHKTKYSKFEDNPEYVKRVCVPAIEICIRKFGRVIVTSGYNCLKYYPDWDGMGCIYMPATVSMQLWGSGDFQPILYYGRPFDIGKRIHKCSYSLSEPPSCKDHPCAKPFKLWKKILSNRSQDDSIILDPFLGSGTTAIAAKQLGRQFIGIEIEEKYCEIAVQRLQQEMLL